MAEQCSYFATVPNICDTRDIGRDRHGALHVVALVLTNGRAFGDVGRVSQQNALALVVENRHIPDLLQ